MNTNGITKSNFIQSAIFWGGALYAANMALWHPINEFFAAGTAMAITHPVGHAIHHAPELPAYVLLAVGMVALARWHGSTLGWVGKIGLYITLIGFALMSIGTFGIVLFEGILHIPVNALETVHPLLLLPLLGSLLYGTAVLKRKLLLPEGAWLIIIAALMFLALIFTGI